MTLTLEDWVEALELNLLDIFAEVNTRSGKPPVVKVECKDGLLSAAR